MTAIHKQALREAAEKALPAMKRLLMMPNDELFDEALLNVDGDVDAANAFNLIAGPETMLALLDELEKSQSWERQWKEAAERRGKRLTWQALEILKQEKRIAELESNEIREDGNQFLVVRHPGKTPVIKHCSGGLEEFLRQLIEQDPLVTIDIITHRHYGVGGQWVQDGDEYLHMMNAAGIGVKGE